MAEASRVRWLMRAFDPLLALTLAAATAFALFAMPSHMFDDVVGRTGLSSVLPAAAAPLGDTARLLVAGFGAVLVGVLAFFGLRAIDRLGPARPIRLRADAVPELRREDAHPDAPARRPIFATLDLGKSLDEGAIEVISKGWPAPAADHQDAPVAMEVENAETVPLTSDSTFDVPERAARPAASLADDAAAAPEETVYAAYIEPPVEPAEAPADSPTSMSEPLPPAARQSSDESVAGLMARLEAGLARRGAAGPDPDQDQSRPRATATR